MKLDGRVAVVTGGARGLGERICVTLAKAGATVVVNTRPGGTPPEATTQAIRSAGGQCEAITADVSDGTQATELMNTVKERFGQLDIVVSNAGVADDALLLEMSEQAWDRVLAVNARGAFNCIRAAAPHMIEQRSGAIVNISSVLADLGSIGAANYAASKGAINSLTRSAALELARFGIRVNAVAPGVVETHLMDRVLGKHRTRLQSRIPLRRFAEGDEIANVVLFLVSDRSAYITGEVIRASGGMGLAC
ncbi:MAG: 3-oxoacyl-ACP reductase FabG [Armatimonadota bacterium]|nr:MAG: 3-oxoacyl-ACP reductase FabG [Armatimonadota bacterium]